jgi:hypothetical protein
VELLPTERWRPSQPNAGRTLARSLPSCFSRAKIEGVAEMDTTLSPELKAKR